MAYNNGFPMSYQPMYYQPQYQQPIQQAQITPQPIQQPAQQSNGIIWVSGEAGAKAYMVAPNTTVQLWDSETQRIFLKSADASGMPSMKILEYTVRDNTSGTSPVNPPQEVPDYAMKTDVEALAAQVEALKSKLETMAKKRVRRDDDDE